jgi:hypothetical protein
VRKILPVILLTLAACQNNSPPPYDCEGLEEFGCADTREAVNTVDTENVVENHD